MSHFPSSEKGYDADPTFKRKNEDRKKIPGTQEKEKQGETTLMQSAASEIRLIAIPF